MSDTTNDALPAEPPVNQGGGTTAKTNLDPTTEDPEALDAEPPVNQGGGSSE